MPGASRAGTGTRTNLASTATGMATTGTRSRRTAGIGRRARSVRPIRATYRVHAAEAGPCAIKGDYAMAGLSLAAAVSGLAFVKVAATLKVGAEAEKTALAAAKIAKVAKEIRVGSAAATSRELAEAGASRIAKSPRPGNAYESQARDELAEKISRICDGAASRPECSTTCSGKRHADIFDPKTGVCIEVKKGPSLRTSSTR
jgi:hypothetical protein